MKDFRWNETWRDSFEFDWLGDMENCDDAIESLRVYIQNCDRKYDSKSINNAEELILDIEDEKVERELYPEWPTNEQEKRFCGIYPCLDYEYVSRETFRRTGEVWKLTPQLLKTRWTSELDFVRWSCVMHGSHPKDVRIEPMPVISEKKGENKTVNIGWDPYDLG